MNSTWLHISVLLGHNGAHVCLTHMDFDEYPGLFSSGYHEFVTFLSTVV